MSKFGVGGAYHWVFQRISAIFLLFLLPWFIYLFFRVLYSDIPSSFDEKLLRVIDHPLELLFFVLLLFCAFWHAVLGVQVVCEDYVRSEILRFFVITFVRYLSSITYIVLVFTIFFFYRRIFF